MHCYYYQEKARECFCRAVVCGCGAGALAVGCWVCACLGAPGCAVACACAAVFCWVGAGVYAHDAKVYRRKAGWF